MNIDYIKSIVEQKEDFKKVDRNLKRTLTFKSIENIMLSNINLFLRKIKNMNTLQTLNFFDDFDFS